MAKLKSTDIYGSLQVQGHTVLDSLVIRESYKDLLEDQILISELSGVPILISDGVIIKGDIDGSSLQIRSISGISETGENKDNLYINFDGGSKYESNRQLIIQSDNAGQHYGHNLYQYAAARGDVVKNWVESKKYYDGSSKISVDYIYPDFALELKHITSGNVGLHNKDGILHVSNEGMDINNGHAVILNNDSRLTDARIAIDVHEWAKKPTLEVSDVPILNQDTTGSAYRLESKRDIKIGGRTLKFDGTEDISYELDDIFNVNTNGFIKRNGNNSFSIDGTSYLPSANATLQEITSRGNTTTQKINIGSSELPVEALTVSGNIRLSNPGSVIATSAGDINITSLSGNGNINLKPNGEGSVNIEGDLNVAGSINTVNAQVIAVKDKVIELGHIDSTSTDHVDKIEPDDETANRGGIILKGSDDKSILWDRTTSSWELNQGLRILGSVRSPGSFYSGNINPSSNTRLNYDGQLRATELYSNNGLVATEKWINEEAVVNDSSKLGGQLPSHYVNVNRKVNGYDLSKDINLTNEDVNASHKDHTHGNISNDGSIGKTEGLIIKTGANGVLNTLAAGTNGQFLAHDGNWETPIDTTYSAGINVSIDDSNKISAIDTTYKAASPTELGLVKTGFIVSGQNYPVELDQDGKAYVSVPWSDTVHNFYNIGFQSNNGVIVDTYRPSSSPSKVLKAGDNVEMDASNNTISISAKDTLYTAGTNVSVNGTVISAIDTTYSAGDNINISAGNVVSAIDTTYDIANISTGGLVKLGTAKSSTLETPAASQVSGRYYPVGLDKNDRVVVNVPWISYVGGSNVNISGNVVSAIDTTYDIASETNPGLVKLGSSKSGTVVVPGASNVAGRYYPVALDKNDKAMVNVPWVEYTTDKGLQMVGSTIGHSNAEISPSTIGNNGNSLLRPGYDGTFKIPTIQYDKFGHIVNGKEIEIKLPSKPIIPSVTIGANTITSDSEVSGNAIIGLSVDGSDRHNIIPRVDTFLKKETSDLTDILARGRRAEYSGIPIPGTSDKIAIDIQSNDTNSTSSENKGSFIRFGTSLSNYDESGNAIPTVSYGGLIGSHRLSGGASSIIIANSNDGGLPKAHMRISGDADNNARVAIGTAGYAREALEVSGNVLLSLANSKIETISGDINIGSRAGNGNVSLKPHGSGIIQLEGNTNIQGDTHISGNLVVEGKINTHDVDILQIEDKVIELGHVSNGEPTDTTSDGGGIILKGKTDKSILWDISGAWVSDQSFKITGNTKTEGAFYTGPDAPNAITRLNYDGKLHATELYSEGELVGTQEWVRTKAVSSDSSKLGGELPGYYVNIDREINGHKLSNDINLTHEDVGASSESHTHGNITNKGAIGSTSGLIVKTGTDGVLNTLAAGTDGQFLAHDGNWETPIDTTYSAGDNITIDASNKISAIDTIYDLATPATAGLVKTGFISSGSEYPVELTQDGKAYVSVPWSNTEYEFNDIKFYANDGSLINTYEPTNGSGKSIKSGTNTQITSSGNSLTISAIDTKYTAGNNVLFSEGNIINAIDTKYEIANTGTAGLIKLGTPINTSVSAPLTPSTKSDRYYSIGLDKDNKAIVNVPWIKYGSGSNISIDGNNNISAIDTKYTAGSKVQINSNNVISATDTTYEIANQNTSGLVKLGTPKLTTLQTPIATNTAGRYYPVGLDKDDKVVVNVPWIKYGSGSNISIDGNNNISAIDTKYGPGTNITIDNNNLISAIDTKYNTANTSTTGLVKLGTDKLTTLSTPLATSISGRYYPIGLDKDDKAVVNVPWISYTANNGIMLSGSTFGHSNNITAASAGNNSEIGSQIQLGYGGTFNVPNIEYDKHGHITTAGNVQVKLPAAPITPAITVGSNSILSNPSDPLTGQAIVGLTVTDSNKHRLVPTVDTFLRKESSTLSDVVSRGRLIPYSGIPIVGTDDIISIDIQSNAANDVASENKGSFIRFGTSLANYVNGSPVDTLSYGALIGGHRLSNGASAFVIANSDSDGKVKTHLRVYGDVNKNNDVRVGIGTSSYDMSSSEALEVNGNILLSNANASLKTRSGDINIGSRSGDGNVNITPHGTGNVNISSGLNIEGDLNVGGNINTVNVDILKVEDKIVELGHVTGGTASDASSNGGGIVLKGKTDKTILWDTSGTWTSNQAFKITGSSKNKGSFYAGVTAPTNIDRLNYDGYLHATKLYSNGQEVLTSFEDTTYTAGSGLVLDGTTFNHSNIIVPNTTGIGPSKNETLEYGGSFTIPQVKYDSEGHLTSVAERTITIPAAQEIPQLSGGVSAESNKYVASISVDGHNITGTMGTLSKVATTGSYNDLLNLPPLPTVMTEAEGQTGIATTGRTISAKALKAIVLNHSPAGSRQASDVYPWAKKATLDASDVPVLNQNTTGSAFKLQNQRDIKIGGRTLQFDGTKDLSYDLDAIFNVNSNGFIKRTGKNTFSIDGTSYLPLASATLQQITAKGNTTTTQVNIGSSDAPVEALSVAGNIRLRNAGGTIATTTGDINIATRAGDGDINLKPHGSGSVNVEGDLNVAGSINTINTQVIAVKDKVIELGHIDPTSSEHSDKLDPDDATANMGGIVLKGATDKTILWNKTTASWEFNNGLRIIGGSKQPGAFYPGTDIPSSTIRLNYDGHLYAKELYSEGQLVGTQSWIINTAIVNDSKQLGGKLPEFYVNKNRTVNNHALDKDITLTYADVGASQNTHGHGNITNLGAIGTTAGLMIKTAANGVLSTLPAGTSGQFLGHDGTWKTPVDTKYTAGDNITIDNNNKIIAVDTKYTTATSSVSGLIKTGYVVSGKTYPVEIDKDGRAYVSVPWANTTYSFYNLAFQNTNGSTVDTYKPSTSPNKVLKAGTNVNMTASSNTITITATDTKYGPGTNITIDNNNLISATDTKYSAGTNVQISNGNVVSATDTTYGIASTSTAGIVKLGTDKLTSLDTPAAKTTAGRYYPIGLDKSDKAVVNVPWIEYSAGEGIKLDGDTFKHSNLLTKFGTIGSNSVGGATIIKPGFGGTFKVPTFTFDKHGHVTDGGDIQIEIPAAPTPPAIVIGNNSNAGANSNATGQAIISLAVDSSNRHRIIPTVDTFLKAETSTLNDVLLRGRHAAYTNNADRIIPGTNGDSIAMDIQVNAANDVASENKGSFIRFGTSLLNYDSSGKPSTATSYGGLIGGHRLPGGASSLIFGNSNTSGKVSHQMKISMGDDGKARVGIGTTGYARDALEVSGDILLSASNAAVRSDIGNLNIETKANGNIVLNPHGSGSINMIGNTNITGDLNVSGTINTVNVDVIKVKDKIIELGHLESGNPTNSTSNGGGIKLLGSSGSAKSILWDSSGTWTSNQAFKITGNSKSAGSLYTGTTAPTSTNRLNYDGHLYATKLYSGGSEVLTSYIDTKYVAGTGLTLDVTTVSPTFNHSNEVTGGASTKGPGKNASPGYSGTFNVPEIEYDANGHIKSATNRVITMPSAQSIPQLSGGVSAESNKYVASISVDGHTISGTMGTIPSIPSIMGTSEGNTGTATTQRTISAKNLKDIILNHSPAGSRPASDVSAWAKKSSLAIGDIPTGTTGTTVALGNHTHSQYLTSFTETDPTVPSHVKSITTGNISSWNGKQSAITGAATTITSNNLTTNMALVSNGSGKVAVSEVTSTELGYLDGVTSGIQTQLDNTVKLIGDQVVEGRKTFTDLVVGSTASSSDMWSIDTPSANHLHFTNTDGINVMTLRKDGRVGINKDPGNGVALDVGGQLQVSGDVRLQGANLFVNNSTNIRPHSETGSGTRKLNIYTNVDSPMEVNIGSGVSITNDGMTVTGSTTVSAHVESPVYKMGGAQMEYDSVSKSIKFTFG